MSKIRGMETTISTLSAWLMFRQTAFSGLGRRLVLARKTPCSLQPPKHVLIWSVFPDKAPCFHSLSYHFLWAPSCFSLYEENYRLHLAPHPGLDCKALLYKQEKIKIHLESEKLDDRSFSL